MIVERFTKEHYVSSLLTQAYNFMAIDAVRMLTESAAKIWQRLSEFNSIETLPTCDSFEVWISHQQPRPALDQTEEQLMRRDYRRLCELLTEIETLVRSRSQAIELVRSRVAEQVMPIPLTS